MKQIFGVLKFVNGYWKYAWLNILFNILSVFFNLFSLLAIIPLLRLLFNSDTTLYQKTVDDGLPAMQYSMEGILSTVNYHMSAYILDAPDLNTGRLKALIGICVAAVVIIFFKSLFRYLAMFFLAIIRNGVVRDLRNKMFHKSLSLPLSWFSSERKGDIMSRMSADVQEVEWSIMSSLEMIFREPVTIVVFLASLVAISPELTLFVFLTTPIIGGVLAIVAKSLKKSSFKAKGQLGDLLSLMEEMLGGLRIIKGFNAEHKVAGRFEATNQAYTKTMVRNYRKTDLASPLSEFLIVIVMCVVMYYGGKLVLDSDESLTAENFIGYIMIFSQLIGPVRQFTQAYYHVQKGLASMDRINVVLHADDQIRDKENAKRMTQFDKEIVYENVSFAYHKGDNGWALRHIDLKIPKGKTIALVGQSGSGKTTMADLLPRLYEVSEGAVKIDGVDIRDVRTHDVRALMGIVSQESILFNDTVLNNIAFGVESATEEQIIAAAKVANAHEFIQQMPEGYHTNIGDRGNKMSGGQRQRLAIARAVLKNPPILILDEATSALDTESERLVQDALNNLMRNRTSIIIAHRLSTIQHADEIIVMGQGVILERGTHNELLESGGTYRKLYDMQVFN
jgi:subfamily B ATP-binding cassette protein MsbA